MLLQVTTIKTVKQMEDLVDLGDGAAWYEKWRIKLTTLFHQVGTHCKHRHTSSFLPVQFKVCEENKKSGFGTTAWTRLRVCLFAGLWLFIGGTSSSRCRCRGLLFMWSLRRDREPPTKGGNTDGSQVSPVCVTACVCVCVCRCRCGGTSRRFSHPSTAAPPT